MDLLLGAGGQPGGEIADYLFENIVEGRQAADIAIFIDDQTDPLLVAAKLDQLGQQRRTGGDEVELLHGAQQRLLVELLPRQQTQGIADMDKSDGIIERIAAEDRTVPAAVARELPHIARLVELVVHTSDLAAAVNREAHLPDAAVRRTLDVIADAATSVLAIFALLGGLLWGAAWLDPLMGIVGGVVILFWAWGLLKESSLILIDADRQSKMREAILAAVSAQKLEISDLHVWRIGEQRYAAIIGLATTQTESVSALRDSLAQMDKLVHLTIDQV